MALAHAGLIHTHGCVAGLLDEAAHENAETVLRLGVGIFHAVAAQPAHKKYCRNLAVDIVRAGDEGPETLAAVVLRPSVEDLGILKVLAFGLGARRLGRSKRSDSGNGQQEKSGCAMSDHREI